jgi:tetratricopeptide (TPR) repeat protein
MKRSLYVLVFLTLLFSGCVKQKAPLIISIPDDIAMCGTIQFTGGCSPQIDTLVTLGITLIHHMTFERAEEIFQQVIDYDPSCFWGPWGKAMTFIHPLWPDTPSTERMLMGKKLSDLAMRLAKTEKEKNYAMAIVSYYTHADKSEAYRLEQFVKAWAEAHESNTLDLEAKAFYALNLLATADDADTTYSRQLQAGALAEEVLQAIPDHPAGFHYVIHAYDHPALGYKALEVARGYSDIAPQIPHALHMPTHIFTRMGLWGESIDWNRRSADVAIKLRFEGEVSMHYFHAMDYLLYANLQLGRDEDAQAILNELMSVPGPYQAHPATAYPLAASEVRYAIEKRDWGSLSSIKTRTPSHFPWDKYPHYESLTHFAKGLGAARAGNLDEAAAALAQLLALKAKMEDIKDRDYWYNQKEIEIISLKAWVAFGKNDNEQALELMRQAADLESATYLHGVTAGYMIPANELLADLLMELDRYPEALAQYEQALIPTPNKLNPLYGAGLAASKAGDQTKAVEYFTKVVENTRESNRPIRMAAEKYLKKYAAS